MPNHFHMLIRLLIADVSDIFQAFTLSCVKSINKRYKRVGSLFQGPFESRLVDKNEYLLHLSRYIHLNPVAANLTKRAEDWEFSSYRDYIGLRNGTLICPGIVLNQFGMEGYRNFVESYHSKDEDDIRHLFFDE